RPSSWTQPSMTASTPDCLAARDHCAGPWVCCAAAARAFSQRCVATTSYWSPSTDSTELRPLSASWRGPSKSRTTTRRGRASAVEAGERAGAVRAIRKALVVMDMASSGGRWPGKWAGNTRWPLVLVALPAAVRGSVVADDRRRRMRRALVDLDGAAVHQV